MPEGGFLFFEPYLGETVNMDSNKSLSDTVINNVSLLKEELRRMRELAGIVSLNEDAPPLVDEKPKPSADSSKPQLIGDPLTDVELNTMVDETGSDGKIAAATEVKAGPDQGGNDYSAGQHKPNFTSKKEHPDS